MKKRVNWYVGDEYSRTTDIYKTKKEAKKALDKHREQYPRTQYGIVKIETVYYK